MSTLKHLRFKRSNWIGFSLQLFLITILPLSVLLLVVAFGSQSLHHEAMRNLVGDRDLRTALAAANSLEKQIDNQANLLKIIYPNLANPPATGKYILPPDEISKNFDGGLALFSAQGSLMQTTSSSIDWQTVSSQLSGFFSTIIQNKSKPEYTTVFLPAPDSSPVILVGVLTAPDRILAGAFTPAKLIENTIGDLVIGDQTTLSVFSRTQTDGDHIIVYRAGPIKFDLHDPSHSGVEAALNGEKGINYSHGSAGENVVAFAPVNPTGWGLIIEEAWQDIASPYLTTTQAAPLILTPVFLLSLAAIWFGARRIVRPLQKLEQQSASLASGNFAAIHQPVGGIEEIRNLQYELIDMADKLKAAQQNLHSYIGAFTDGVENERRSLARELHDDTIQALIAINQRLQMILVNSSETQKEALSELLKLVQQSMTNLRRMIRGLRPIYLEDLGLVASLEMLANEVGLTTDISVSFHSSGEERRLDPQSEMSLYRMAQESLNNAVQHSAALHISLEVEFSDEGLTVQVHDDGKGFVLPSNPAEFPQKGHFGLLGLQERAELIDARLEIDTEIGKGTTIRIVK